jgi:hypothetical protein
MLPGMFMLQKLPLGLNTLSRIREEGCLYVDKTEAAYKLITQGYRYFLTRPRRFGKSLFISTLKEILEGNKELFEGLWIANSNYQWRKHGVIKLDMSSLTTSSQESFKRSLCKSLARVARGFKLQISLDPLEPADALKDLVDALREQFDHIAILVDEYDGPILHTLQDPERASAIRDTIRIFFTVIKELDADIDFVFITGVSSFIKAGLFSGINNLEIITLDEQYANICGYTDEEVDRYFSEHIASWAEKESSSYGETRAKIKEWYNGYHFGDNTPSIYNPYSLMSALKAQNFKNYWFVSGLPTFLADFLKKEYRTFDPEHLSIKSNILQGLFDIGAMPLKALMFQAGYLTIANYDKERDVYELNFPNREVRGSFQDYLLEAFTQLDTARARELSETLWTAFSRFNIEDIVDTIRQLFAHVPYQLHMKEEKYYHSLLQTAFSAIGIKAQSEYSTSDGRIDLVLELPKLIYIIEVKFGNKAQEALAQIEHKKYYERFLHQKKKIILLGLAFIREPGSFDVDYAVKELS